MNFVKQIERLQYLDRLITKQSTGTPDELAERLGISRSQLYNLINYFNEIGIEVKYSKRLHSFYYKSDSPKIEINFSINILTKKEVHRIYGSSNLAEIFFESSSFLYTPSII